MRVPLTLVYRFPQKQTDFETGTHKLSWRKKLKGYPTLDNVLVLDRTQYLLQATQDDFMGIVVLLGHFAVRNGKQTYGLHV